MQDDGIALVTVDVRTLPEVRLHPAFARIALRPLPSTPVMGSLIKKRRKRMRKKKHKKMLKRTRWQRRAGK